MGQESKLYNRMEPEPVRLAGVLSPKGKWIMELEQQNIFKAVQL